MGPVVRRISNGLNYAVLVFATIAIAGWYYHHGRGRLADHPAPPIEWALAVAPADQLDVPGYDIPYWGDPDAQYGIDATRTKAKPRAVVVHFTGVKPVLDMVAYGHSEDRDRGGFSYGYHFYIGRGGRIVQGAPLSKRTNHIKPPERAQRREIARELSSGNTIGITLVGGCDSLIRPNWRLWSGCSGEYLTGRQLRAGLALIRAIQEKFDIPCAEVYGHGELQTDRAPFEGATLARLVRARCLTTASRG